MRFALLLLVLATCFCSCRAVPETPAEIPSTVEGYKKLLEDRLGPIWSRAVARDSAVSLGTVKLTFEIAAAGGSPRNLKVVANDAGAADERIARSAINQLRAPPIPATVLKAGGEDYLAFDESFTVYLESDSSPPKKR